MFENMQVQPDAYKHTKIEWIDIQEILYVSPLDWLIAKDTWRLQRTHRCMDTFINAHTKRHMHKHREMNMQTHAHTHPDTKHMHAQIHIEWKDNEEIF